MADWREAEISGIGMTTLLGYVKPITPGDGNCFGGIEIDGMSLEEFRRWPLYAREQVFRNNEGRYGAQKVTLVEHRLINLRAESLEQLMEDGVLSYPVKVLIPVEGYAVAVDERIPAEWLTSYMCWTCLPSNVIDLVLREGPEVMDPFMLKRRTRPTDQQEISPGLTTFKGESTLEAGYFWAPYVPRYSSTEEKEDERDQNGE